MLHPPTQYPRSPVTTAVAFTTNLHTLPRSPSRLCCTNTILAQYYSTDRADLYQVGLEIVSQHRKFLSNFDPDRFQDSFIT